MFGLLGAGFSRLGGLVGGAVDPAEAVNNLLLETGDDILLESGDFLLLEA